jgi:hypothetical protein
LSVERQYAAASENIYPVDPRPHPDPAPRRDPENLNDQLTQMRREVAETTADDLADNVSPLVLAEFRAALALALTAEPPDD